MQGLEEASSIAERELGVVQEHLHVVLQSLHRRQLRDLSARLDSHFARSDTASSLSDLRSYSLPDIDGTD